MAKKDEKVFIQINDERIELTGKDLEEFLQLRNEYEVSNQKSIEEANSQKELKISAYKKLGLTDEEIAAII